MGLRTSSMWIAGGLFTLALLSPVGAVAQLNMPNSGESAAEYYNRVNQQRYDAAEQDRQQRQRDQQRQLSDYHTQQQQQFEAAERQRRDDVLRYQLDPRGMGSGPYNR